jgi:hypothetical protein
MPDSFPGLTGSWYDTSLDHTCQITLCQTAGGGNYANVASAAKAHPAEDLLKLVGTTDGDLGRLHQSGAQPYRAALGQSAAAVHAGTLPHARSQPGIADQLLRVGEAVDGLDLGQQGARRQLSDTRDRQQQDQCSGISLGDEQMFGGLLHGLMHIVVLWGRWSERWMHSRSRRINRSSVPVITNYNQLWDTDSEGKVSRSLKVMSSGEAERQ